MRLYKHDIRVSHARLRLGLFGIVALGSLVVSATTTARLPPLGTREHDLTLLAYLTVADSLNFWTYLEPSLRLFWPDARIVAVLDDTPRERVFAKELPANYGIHFSSRYLGRAVYHKLRSELAKFHADEVTNSEYVGFVDADTLFTTWVMDEVLFHGRRPILIAGAGTTYDSPFWDVIPSTTREFLGGKENITCMLQFPEIYFRAHIREAREAVEDHKGWPRGAFEARATLKATRKGSSLFATGAFCEFNIFCNFVFTAKRDEYVVHVQDMVRSNPKAALPQNPNAEVPAAVFAMARVNANPALRVAVHGGWLAPGGSKCRNPDRAKQRLKITSSLQSDCRFWPIALQRMIEGYCFSSGGSTGRKVCDALRRDPGAVYDPLFEFEAAEITPHQRWSAYDRGGCLAAQQRYLRQVGFQAAFNESYVAEILQLQQLRSHLNLSTDLRESTAPRKVPSYALACAPWDPRDKLQSPSCNPYGTIAVEPDKCCPPCCQTNGKCGTCDLARCLEAEPSAPAPWAWGAVAVDSSPWSRAYTDGKRAAFMVVLQRPFLWNASTECSCGDGNPVPAMLLTPPAPGEDQWGPGFEESLRHRAPSLAKETGCCVPAKDADWFTRSLYCTFSTACAASALSLHGGSDEGALQGAFEVPVEVMSEVAASGPLGTTSLPSSGATICVPRLDRVVATKKLASGFLVAWLQTHAARDVRRVFFYSDDCLGSVLTKAALAKISAALRPAQVAVEVVDISSLRAFNGWYHHQMVAVQDCYARSVMVGHPWVLFLDADEFLGIPKGWTALDFGGARVLSFASLNPCNSDHDQPEACSHTFRGHRKCAHSTSLLDGLAPTPPGFIHGDAREAKFNFSSGVFVLHLRTHCKVTDAVLPKGSFHKVQLLEWVDELRAARGWPAQAQEGQGAWMEPRSDAVCAPYEFTNEVPWNYDFTDKKLATMLRTKRTSAASTPQLKTHDRAPKHQKLHKDNAAKTANHKELPSAADLARADRKAAREKLRKAESKASRKPG